MCVEPFGIFALASRYSRDKFDQWEMGIWNYDKWDGINGIWDGIYFCGNTSRETGTIRSANDAYWLKFHT
uniref:Uncharacterized protein n=1 Tax=Rhizophagus irregularis (strain DAOM 181602 / DAOM 197198 / MUCL 43194) TaxID=747089 RepID=U9U165_RHIID